MLYKYDSKEMGLSEIVKREMEKCFVDNKEGQVRN